jgi:NAD-dependent SIR2 family protein deacetylase
MAASLHPLAQSELSKEADWNAPNMEALASAYRAGRLCLILGAGVSKGCGLPVWQELTRELLRRSLAGLYESVGPSEAPLHERDIEAVLKDRVRPMVARYVKAKLGDSYLDVLRQTLYAKPWRPSGTLRAILSLDGVHAVLTQNFDDLLESCASRMGLSGRYQTIFDAPMDPRTGRIPIFHTHGYLPSDASIQGSRQIVFSEDDYHELFHQGRPWSDHVTIQLLARYPCLMIGTSGEDPNLRRLLDLARRLAVPPRHYLLLKPPAPLPRDRRGAIRYTASRRALWDAFDHLGIEVLWIHHYDRDITRVLATVRGDPGAPARGREDACRPA